MNLNILGIIPARGGSKGLPRKNILPLAGKPLLTYAIESGKQSHYINHIVTSTEDNEIAEVARQHHCDVIDRPIELAADDTKSESVITHVLESFSNKIDIIVLLQPTAPLRIAQDIDGCIELLIAKNANSVISVTQAQHCHPIHLYQMHEHQLQPFMAEPPSRRRQDLAPIYFRNGLVYVCKVDWFLKTNNLVSPETLGYETPIERAANIDSAFDLKYAEFLLS